MTMHLSVADAIPPGLQAGHLPGERAGAILFTSPASEHSAAVLAYADVYRKLKKMKPENI